MLWKAKDDGEEGKEANEAAATRRAKLAAFHQKQRVVQVAVNLTELLDK